MIALAVSRERIQSLASELNTAIGALRATGPRAPIRVERAAVVRAALESLVAVAASYAEVAERELDGTQALAHVEWSKDLAARAAQAVEVATEPGA